jgi:hypothetical protein
MSNPLGNRALAFLRVSSVRRRRLLRVAATGLLGAVLGLWLAFELYDGHPIREPGPPSLADRLPWLTHPLLAPLGWAGASVLLLLLGEGVARRARRRP